MNMLSLCIFIFAFIASVHAGTEALFGDQLRNAKDLEFKVDKELEEYFRKTIMPTLLNAAKNGRKDSAIIDNRLYTNWIELEKICIKHKIVIAANLGPLISFSW